jgi:hypothetical protein
MSAQSRQAHGRDAGQEAHLRIPSLLQPPNSCKKAPIHPAAASSTASNTPPPPRPASPGAVTRARYTHPSARKTRESERVRLVCCHTPFPWPPRPPPSPPIYQRQRRSEPPANPFRGSPATVLRLSSSAAAFWIAVARRSSAARATEIVPQPAPLTVKDTDPHDRVDREKEPASVCLSSAPCPCSTAIEHRDLHLQVSHLMRH